MLFYKIYDFRNFFLILYARKKKIKLHVKGAKKLAKLATYVDFQRVMFRKVSQKCRKSVAFAATLKFFWLSLADNCIFVYLCC